MGKSQFAKGFCIYAQRRKWFWRYYFDKYYFRNELASEIFYEQLRQNISYEELSGN